MNTNVLTLGVGLLTRQHHSTEGLNKVHAEILRMEIGMDYGANVLDIGSFRWGPYVCHALTSYDGGKAVLAITSTCYMHFHATDYSYTVVKR